MTALQHETPRGSKSRFKRAMRPLRRFAVTSAVFAGAVAWTASLDTPWKREMAQLTASPVIVQPTSTTEEIGIVARVLNRHTKDASLAEEIASAIVTEGRRENIEPSLLVGVLLTENARLETHARSNVGAQGLMQVMPFHKGKWSKCESTDLTSIEGNVCHGVQIFADLLKRKKSTDKALLAYNGCVRGTNTPRCHTYPSKVRRFAAQAEKQMVAFASAPLEVMASPIGR